MNLVYAFVLISHIFQRDAIASKNTLQIINQFIIIIQKLIALIVSV